MQDTQPKKNGLGFPKKNSPFAVEFIWRFSLCVIVFLWEETSFVAAQIITAVPARHVLSELFDHPGIIDSGKASKPQTQ